MVSTEKVQRKESVATHLRSICVRFAAETTRKEQVDSDDGEPRVTIKNKSQRRTLVRAICLKITCWCWWVVVVSV